MTIYRVTLYGEAREVYEVEAESEDDARAGWMHSFPVITECFGMEVDSVRVEDDA